MTHTAGAAAARREAATEAANVARTFVPAAPAGASPHLVLINVSPIEYGHVLLVPRALDCLPQLVTPATLLLALQLAREAGEQSELVHAYSMA